MDKKHLNLALIAISLPLTLSTTAILLDVFTIRQVEKLVLSVGPFSTKALGGSYIVGAHTIGAGTG